MRAGLQDLCRGEMMNDQSRDQRTRWWAIGVGGVAVAIYVGFFLLMHFRG